LKNFQEGVQDPNHTESGVPETPGLGLLDMDVVFEKEKMTAQASGMVMCSSGWPEQYNGMTIDGYEIHAGKNTAGPEAVPWMQIGGCTDGVMNPRGNVMGTYLHGLFDDGQLFAAIASQIRTLRGESAQPIAPLSFEEFREKEFDRIAAIVRSSVDMDAIYRIIRGEAVPCVSELPH
jgi:adenosylcobyric acid synthase